MSSRFEGEMNVVFKFWVVSVFLGLNCRPVELFKDFKNPVSLSGIVQSAKRKEERNLLRTRTLSGICCRLRAISLRYSRPRHRLNLFL